MTGTTDALRKIHNADWQTPWEVEFMAYTAPLDPNEAPMMVDAQADLDDARDARFSRFRAATHNQRFGADLDDVPTLPHFADLRDGGNLHKAPRDWLGAVMGLTVLALLVACVWAVQ